MQTWARQSDDGTIEIPREIRLVPRRAACDHTYRDRTRLPRTITLAFYLAAFLLTASVFFVRTGQILPRHKTVINLSLREPRPPSSKVLEGDRRRPRRPSRMLPFSPLVQQNPVTGGPLA